LSVRTSTGPGMIGAALEALVELARRRVPADALVLVGPRRARDLLELELGLRHRFDRGWCAGGEFILDRPKRRVRIRLVEWPVGTPHLRDGFDLVVVDRDLPVAVLAGARAASRGSTVSW
jgi:hypothetical protein